MILPERYIEPEVIVEKKIVSTGLNPYVEFCNPGGFAPTKKIDNATHSFNHDTCIWDLKQSSFQLLKIELWSGNTGLQLMGFCNQLISHIITTSSCNESKSISNNFNWIVSPSLIPLSEVTRIIVLILAGTVLSNLWM